MMIGSSAAAASQDISKSSEAGLADNAPKPTAAAPIQPIMIPCGLENLGNTCYLNASLQCMTASMPELKQALVSFYHASKDEPGLGQKKFVAAMGATLEEMKESSSVSPFLLVQLFRLLYPQFNQRGEEGGFAQQDAEECYSLLLASIQQVLKQAPGVQEPVASLLTGEWTSTLTCDEDPELSPTVTVDSFTKLDCHISQATNHLLSGLTEALTTNLEMNHPTLGRPVKYTKKSQITALPPYLTVHFIRFFWKKVEKVKAKILKRVSFPIQLDVYPLCTPAYQEAVLRPVRERMAIATATATTADASTAVPQPDSAKEGTEPNAFPEPSGYYELVGVLTHAGRSADGGHYVGWVRDEHKRK